MLYESASTKPTPKEGEENWPERVVIINDLSVMRGGATGVALSSAVGLRDLDIPVTFISGDDGGEISPQHCHIDFVPLGGQHILEGSRLRAAVNGIFNSQAYSLLAGWIEKNDTARTIYHVHGWSKILSPSIFRALQLVASRLVIHAHDHFLVCPNGAYYDFHHDELCNRRPLSLSCLSCQCDRRSYLQKLWRTGRQFTLGHIFDFPGDIPILPVHAGMKPLLALGGIPMKNMHAMRNPVTPWRSERVEAENNHNFLYVGRLDESKGVISLAKAARSAGISLRMVGIGPLAARLEQEYPEIQLLGWKSRQELSNLSADTRVVVMPSNMPEPFGLVAFEALMSGIPVIVSDRAMIAREIEKNGWGLVGSPEKEQQFAELLRKMANDNVFVAQASKRGYTNATQLTPDLKSYTIKLLSLYKDVFLRNSTDLS